MPGTVTFSPAIGDQELSANLFSQVEDLNRMKNHPYPFVDDLMSHADKSTGGERIIVRFDVEDHSVATRVQSGYESFDKFAQPTMKPGYQGWGIVVVPIFISRVEEQQNKGGVLNILKERTTTVHEYTRRITNLAMWRGGAASGTHPGVVGFDDFLSVNGGDTSTGILEDQADGTNTLHGITKSSYPLATHEQFHNFFADCAGAFATNGLNALHDSLIRMRVREGKPNPKDSKWYWSENFAKLAKRSLRSLEHYTTDGNMDDGMRRADMMYGGIPVEIVAELPSTGSASATNPWSAVRINWKLGMRFRAMQGYLWDFDEFKELSGSVGTRYSLGWFWGQLISTRPGVNAVIVDGEA